MMLKIFVPSNYVYPAFLFAFLCHMTSTANLGSVINPIGPIIFILIFCCQIFGELINKKFLDRENNSLVDIFIGYASISILAMIAALLFNFSVATSFFILSILSLIVKVLINKRGDAGCSVINRFLFIFITIIFSFIWSWKSAGSYRMLESSGVFNAWTDFFTHSAYIAQFSNIRSLDGASLFLKSDTISVYHYASYMLPAAVAEITNVPTLVIATSVWAPLSFAFMGLGACILGEEFNKKAGGLAGILAVFGVPSAAYYWPHTAFFNFHWLLQISPTGGYSIGISLVATAVALTELRNRPSSLPWRAFGVCLLAAPFRVHIFVLLVLAIALFTLISWKPSNKSHRIMALVLGICGLAVGIVLAERIQRAPHFITGQFDQVRAYATMLGVESSGAFAGALTYLQSLHIPLIFTVGIGVVLIFAAAFGLLLPLYGAGILLVRSRRALSRQDSVPGIFLIAYAIVLLTFPLTGGDPIEFQHRPFVLVFAILSIWLGSTAAAIIFTSYPNWALSVKAGAISLALIFTVAETKNIQLGGNSWAKGVYVDAAIPVGLIQSASYIRSHSGPTDVIWSDDGDPSGIVVGLTERTAFVSLEAAYASIPGKTQDIISSRRPISESLRQARTEADFSAAAERYEIDWYILSPQQPVADDEARRVVFSSFGYRVLHYSRRGTARNSQPPSS